MVTVGLLLVVFRESSERQPIPMTSNVVSEILMCLLLKKYAGLLVLVFSHTTASCWQALRSDFITEKSDLLLYVKNVQCSGKYSLDLELKPACFGSIQELSQIHYIADAARGVAASINEVRRALSGVRGVIILVPKTSAVSQ